MKKKKHYVNSRSSLKCQNECVCVYIGKSVVPHLPRSLQVSKVDVWNEENGLGVQVSNAFEQRTFSPLYRSGQPRAAIFP